MSRKLGWPYEQMFVYARAMTNHDLAQRAVLRLLLQTHPRMLGLDELTAQLADVPRAREATRVLVDDGLATRLGDRVGLSRAAVRFDALTPM
jgi:hypothetical protein